MAERKLNVQRCPYCLCIGTHDPKCGVRGKRKHETSEEPTFTAAEIEEAIQRAQTPMEFQGMPYMGIEIDDLRKELNLPTPGEGEEGS